MVGVCVVERSQAPSVIREVSWRIAHEESDLAKRRRNEVRLVAIGAIWMIFQVSLAKASNPLSPLL
jgi:hypothetical protein